MLFIVGGRRGQAYSPPIWAREWHMQDAAP
jgi:hypothetical protein